MKKLPLRDPQVGPTSLKKNKTCKHGLPHDFELVIPRWYVSMRPQYAGLDIKEFYKMWDNREVFKNFSFNLKTRYYTCKVCGKEEIMEEKIAIKKKLQTPNANIE